MDTYNVTLTGVAEKNAGKIHSGIQVNPATGSSKGTKATNTPYTVCCGGGGGYPSSYELNVSSNPVASTWEPSNGCMPNFGAGSSSTDDYKDNYCVQNSASAYGDKDFYNLCGPGAADIALWYWPNPPNLLSDTVTDTAPVRIASNGQPFTTYWSSERMRGYMTYLAWQIAWPSGGLSHAGMMDNSHYPSYATTLYGMVDALNWEESNRTTLNGFYAIRWKNQTSQSTLLSDVETDIAGNNVPIVAEVDAGHLPNWTTAATGVYHFITIIGYDNNAGTYSYTDTCANSTNCNWTGHGTDGEVHTISQLAMWNAINAVTLNQSTAPNAGDGGYVW